MSVVERWENGVLIEVMDDGIEFVYPPLDAAGALATLLVVEGVLPIEDAANSQRTTPEHLIAEAEAWAIAAP